TTSYTRWCSPDSAVDPMYMAGRTRTASRPSRTRMAPASYSAAASTVLMSSVMSPGGTLLCRPHPSVSDFEHASQSGQPGHPVPVGGSHQGLAPLRHRAAQDPQPLLVELGVEVVEESDRRLAPLLAVHLDRGQGEGQQKAAGLAGGCNVRGLLAVHAQGNRVTMGADHAPPRTPLRAARPAHLLAEDLALGLLVRWGLGLR